MNSRLGIPAKGPKARETSCFTAQMPSITFLDRRCATRYEVSMRMEIWPAYEYRRAQPKFVKTRDVSLRGVYFFSEEERPTGTRVNFSVVFVHGITRRYADLISGQGRIVRCDPLPDRDSEPFGVAMAIDKTSYIFDG
ncbi:MAG TPA: hypothetical protein VMB47_09330 [Candidatus Aquilonibacter sp.]|nr:hypothetical protein [Candidatus Aquilonibacter sp.]